MWGVVVAACGEDLEWVKVSQDKKGFVCEESGERFVPLGFNYDHDDEGRLLEDYWHLEWRTVEEDFLEMKRLGANVVRIHLQVGRFMRAQHWCCCTWGSEPGRPESFFPPPPPAQTRQLEAPKQGKGWVFLDWKQPLDGGRVIAYHIQRRNRTEGAWQDVA